MQNTHRVGTITLGGMLIIFGTLFLLRIFLPDISYSIIFRLWPIIFIFLGGEVLIANFRQKAEKMIYDKTAIAILILLTCFAMGMAVIDFSLTAAHDHLILY
jgi:UDP-N-acetylmuramyl pentapeptide phosphotransferase/UDP-N-acetylglucosamine-1-phosphate transferase